MGEGRMIESWWKAHELEVWLTVGFFGLIAFVWLVDSLISMREERRQRKKDGLL
jgi:hypothetical protein